MVRGPAKSGRGEESKMSNEEVKSETGEVCEICGGSGVATLRKQLLPDVGNFCECESGKARWEAMVTAMEEFERPTERLVGERRFDPSARRVEQLLSTI